jgi:hypothetical protein
MRRDIQRTQFFFKFHRIADIGQQVSQWNQLTVVEYAADKAGVGIAPLFAVGDHISASAQLCFDR